MVTAFALLSIAGSAVTGRAQQPALPLAQPPAAPTPPNANLVRISHSVADPDATLRRKPVHLVFEIEADAPMSSGQLTLTAPQTIDIRKVDKVDPNTKPASGSAATNTVTIPIGAFTGRVRTMVAVTPRNESLLKGQYRVIAELRTTRQSDGASVSANDVIAMEAVPELDLAQYLLIGVGGVLLGWVLRLLLQAQAKVPAPSPVPVADGDSDSPGPITRFIMKYYYQFDAAITAVLGFLALLALVTNGHPPDTAGVWYAALLLGVGLGLLANTDLVLRIRR
jgi:hypothetical protein